MLSVFGVFVFCFHCFLEGANDGLAYLFMLSGNHAIGTFYYKWDFTHHSLLH